MEIKNYDNTYFGFSSIGEYINIFSGTHNKSLLMIQLFFTYIATIAASFDLYIYHPSQQYYVIVSLLVADNITGILVALLIKKEGFSTKKCQRFVFLLIGYTCAMSASFWMAKTAYFYEFLPYVVFYYLSSVLFLSFIKNLSILKWLPDGLNKFLNKFIDKRKDELVEMARDGFKK